MDNIYVGPAGWAYDDWAGIVYPAKKPARFDHLEYLSGFFDCIEVNSTFYRIPLDRMSASWARRVNGNDRFRFTAKLYRGFTHERRALSRRDAAAFRKGIAPLLEAGRLGCVLVQFPWSFKKSEENRSYLGALFREFETLPLVLEVRHTSWNTSSFYGFLSERGVGFCNIDQPLFGGSMEPSARRTSSIGYFRLHGQNCEDWFREGAGRDERYDYLYSGEELEPWVERVKSLRRHLSSVYLILNNHYRGKAACNALQLKARLSAHAVDVPPPLARAYPLLKTIAASTPGQGDLFEVP